MIEPTSVRLTQIDGKLPNLALMKLAHFHRARGQNVVLTKHPEPDLYEPRYAAVYGSAIFSRSAEQVARLRAAFPAALVGGTWNPAVPITIEEALGLDQDHEHYDYSIYPNFAASIGFTQRGCRLKCGFCVVPRKEGKPRSVNSIRSIWRGDQYPKHIHLLDNDFFGQAEWRERIEEIRVGGFRVAFSQGINVRMVTDEVAAALSSIFYSNHKFERRRLYTAWDNLKDEEVFFRGIDTLERHGVLPSSIMAYMLIGYDKRETWERVLHRFDRMVARKIKPYPMVYGSRECNIPKGDLPDVPDWKHATRKLGGFQRWVLRGIYRTGISFWDYDVSARRSAADTEEEFEL